MYKRIMVALAALALTGPALADAPVGLTISPMVGQTWLDDLDDESHWQIGVGYQFDNPGRSNSPTPRWIQRAPVMCQQSKLTLLAGMWTHCITWKLWAK